jgi:hypothetical protein
MAKRKKKKDAAPVQSETPNRYGAQGLTTDDGEPCCCHRVPLSDCCDGCVALESTKRKPTLVAVPRAVPAGVGYEAPIAGIAEAIHRKNRTFIGDPQEPPVCPQHAEDYEPEGE